MMSDNDLSKKLSEISRDAKPRMSDPEIELDPFHTAMSRTPTKGNTWSMWPMYLCFGMLFVILMFTFLPRWY